MTLDDTESTVGRYDGRRHRLGTRLVLMVVLFLGASAIVGLLTTWWVAPAVGWIVASGAFVIRAWLVLFRWDAAETAAHATREDPTRTAAHVLLIVASLASFGAIAVLLVESASVGGAARFALAGLTLVTIAASWFLVHTLFTLRYAALYYRGGGTGIDFAQPEPPRYLDFAYVAFTLGMTYQVSDTTLTTTAMRGEALAHALLSFLLGVVVLAVTINLIATLVR